jgi:glycosyltransferase involved in cell wall biosynthesis
MIHEVGGEAYPWQRGYYRIRKQLRILKLLGKLSDSVITSSKYNQQILNEICVPAITSVVPSNIEEGDNISLQQERWVDQKESNCFRVVVFGMQGKRIKTIKWHRFLLRELHEKRLLSEVVIIGKNFTQKDYSVREVEMLAKFIPKDSIKILGEQKSGAISLELSKSHILLSHFQINDFEKSGTIKAALAHGVVPILKGNADETHMIMEMFDGTRVGAKHLADKINMAYLSEMSKAGKARYSENYSWDKVVDVYKSVIQKMKNERVVNGLNQNNKNP